MSKFNVEASLQAGVETPNLTREYFLRIYGCFGRDTSGNLVESTIVLVPVPRWIIYRE